MIMKQLNKQTKQNIAHKVKFNAIFLKVFQPHNTLNKHNAFGWFQFPKASHRHSRSNAPYYLVFTLGTAFSKGLFVLVITYQR